MAGKPAGRRYHHTGTGISASVAVAAHSPGCRRIPLRLLVATTVSRKEHIMISTTGNSLLARPSAKRWSRPSGQNRACASISTRRAQAAVAAQVRPCLRHLLAFASNVSDSWRPAGDRRPARAPGSPRMRCRRLGQAVGQAPGRWPRERGLEAGWCRHRSLRLLRLPLLVSGLPHA